MRTPIVILALLICPAISSGQVAGCPEAEIVSQIRGYEDAWNRGHAEELASYVDAEGDRMNALGTVFKGRSEFQNHYREVFSKPPPAGTKRQLSYDDIAVRCVTADVAIVDGKYEASGVGPDPSLVARGRNFVVMVKRGGKWLRAAHRNWLLITPDCYRQCTGQ